jgi:hypothetical protein
VGEDLIVIFKSLEFQRIAAGVTKKECCLFAGLSLKADIRRDDEGNIARCQFRGQRLPLRHRQDCTEMTHRNLVAVNLIMRFVSGLIRA